MAFSSKQLTSGEHVELEMRTHLKAIVGPILAALLLLAILVAALMWVPSGSARGWILLVIGAALLVAALVAVVIPVLRWLTSVYVVTNRRIITRHGILSKTGRDVPLYRINDVSYDQGPSDRLLGCGTLLVSDASDNPPLHLPDVPHVQRAQVRITELLFAHEAHAERAARSDGGPEDGPTTRPLRRRDEPYDQRLDERYPAEDDWR